MNGSAGYFKWRIADDSCYPTSKKQCQRSRTRATKTKTRSWVCSKTVLYLHRICVLWTKFFSLHVASRWFNQWHCGVIFALQCIVIFLFYLYGAVCTMVVFCSRQFFSLHIAIFWPMFFSHAVCNSHWFNLELTTLPDDSWCFGTLTECLLTLLSMTPCRCSCR